MDKKEAIKARRAHIIQSALSCFLEKGFNQTGIRDIAKRAGISLGNLYNHFPSKKAVLIAIASLEAGDIAQFAEELSDHAVPEATLRRFLVTYTTYCNQSDHVALLFEVIGEAIRDEEIAALFSKNHDHLVDALELLLEAGQATGVFRSQTDNREIADILLDSIEGYATRMVLGMRKPETDCAILHDFLMRSVLA